MPLQLNHTYIHTGNSFSHAFLVAQESRFSKKLIVVESFQEALRMEDIFRVFPDEKIQLISSPTDFFSFQDSTQGTFLCTPDIFFWDMGKEGKNFPLHALTLETGQTLTPKALVEMLEQMGYQFSRDIWKEGVFFMEGETLHIHPLKSEDIFLISLFEDTIDAIVATNEAKTTFKNVEAIKILGKVDKTALRFYENWSLAHFKNTLENTLVFLIQLDFLEKLESLPGGLPHFVNFRHIKTDYALSLEVKNVLLETPLELAEITKNPKLTIECYTKNPPALRQFFATHDIPERKIIHTTNRHLKSFSL